MKRIFWISVAAVAIFAFSLDAFAQPGGGQGPQGQRQAGAFGQMGGVTAPGQLLRNEEVVKMLALTDSQTSDLNAVPRPQRGQGQAGGGMGGGAVPTIEEMRQRSTEQWAGINRILNAEQQAKFKEIYFQANNGLNSMQLDDWMLAVVDLTAEQKESIAKIAAERTAATRAAMPQGGAGGGQGLSQEERRARQAETTARNTRFADQIKAVLTPEQTTKATQLTEGAAALRTALGIPPAGQRGQGAGAGGRQGGARGGN